MACRVRVTGGSLKNIFARITEPAAKEEQVKAAEDELGHEYEPSVSSCSYCAKNNARFEKTGEIYRDPSSENHEFLEMLQMQESQLIKPWKASPSRTEGSTGFTSKALSLIYAQLIFSKQTWPQVASYRRPKIQDRSLATRILDCKKHLMESCFLQAPKTQSETVYFSTVQRKPIGELKKRLLLSSSEPIWAVHFRVQAFSGVQRKDLSNQDIQKIGTS